MIVAALCGSVWAGAPTLVWSGAEVTLLGGPSRDGRHISYVDPGTRNLALREVASGRTIPLTSKPDDSREFAYFSSIAPDSRRVAYAWFDAEGFYELRTVDLDGSHVQTVCRNPEAGFLQPSGWSPDSRFILTLLFRKDNISQLALVPADGRAPKVLRSLNWAYPKRMDLSPDGRYIVYDSFAGESSGDRTIYLLSVDGTRERKLVTAPGNHLFPLWAPDGKRVVYASDRSGTMDLWSLAIEDGEARGEPRLVRRDLGRILPMAIAADGRLFYGLRSGSVDVFVTTLADPARDARRVTIRYPGRNRAPAWSKDGMALAYLSRRGSENFGEESRAIVVRRLDSDDERELLPELAHLERVQWSPDGKSLLVSGSDNKGRGGVYIVDAASGVVKPLASHAGAPFRGHDAAWSSDGRSVYYIRADKEVRGRDRESGAESVIYRGDKLRHLAASPDGRLLAVGIADRSIGRIPLRGGEPRVAPFAGLSELEWGRELVAERGAELWRIPVDGGAPVKLKSPGNREAGFSLEPRGDRIALTAGDARSEVWVLPLE